MPLISVLALLFLSFPSLAQAQSCPALDAPSTVRAEEQFWSIGIDYVLTSGGQRVGTVIERTLNWTTTFELQNAQGEIVATARERFFAWGTTIDVFDCRGNRIGIIRENIFQSLLGLYTNYDIDDASGRDVATSERFSFLTTDFVISDHRGDPAVRMHRPFTLVLSTWDITIPAGSGIDPRIALMIPAFQSAAEAHYSGD